MSLTQENYVRLLSSMNIRIPPSSRNKLNSLFQVFSIPTSQTTESSTEPTQKMIPFPGCNSMDSFSDFDLNKFVFTSELCENYDYSNVPHSDKIPGKLHYRVDEITQVDLCEIRFLSKGSYGYVFEYKTTSEPYYQVAIKTYNKPDDSEIAFVQDLQNKGIDCNLINAKILQEGQTTVCVMDLMNGNLSQIVKPRIISQQMVNKPFITSTQAVEIWKLFVTYMDCLFKKGYIYSDIKLHNILFKCVKDDLKIVLGDLGSIHLLGERCPVTFPPPESFLTNEVVADENLLLWGTGILLASLLRLSIKTFYTDNFFKIIVDQNWVNLTAELTRLKNKNPRDDQDNVRIQELERQKQDLLRTNLSKVQISILFQVRTYQSVRDIQIGSTNAYDLLQELLIFDCTDPSQPSRIRWENLMNKVFPGK